MRTKRDPMRTLHARNLAQSQKQMDKLDAKITALREQRTAWERIMDDAVTYLDAHPENES